MKRTILAVLCFGILLMSLTWGAKPSGAILAQIAMPDGAVLTIVNGAPRPQGPGQAPVALANGTPHSVTLYITPATQPAGVTVAGYNFYRAATAAGIVGSTAINGTTPVSATTVTCPAGVPSPCVFFVDSTVTAGAALFYSADTQATTGNQSPAFTPAVAVTVPQNPLAPGAINKSAQ